MLVIIQDITKEGRLCMKSPIPKAYCVESVFLMQSSICTANLTNMSRSD